MKERPILFSGPMVRAILEGKKTQTRRIVHPTHVSITGEIIRSSPFGYYGDRLWVRETWDFRDWEDAEAPHRVMIAYGADGAQRECERPADWNPTVWRPSIHMPRWASRTVYGREVWRPSIHMPRWASRISLEVMRVRVERLQTISGADILAEGAVERPHEVPGLGRCPVSRFDAKCYPDLMSLWRAGWDSLNGKRAPWSSNPRVWVVEFRRVEGGVNSVGAF